MTASLFRRWRDRARRSPATPVSAARRLCPLALEPRMLFDGAAAPVALDLAAVFEKPAGGSSATDAPLAAPTSAWEAVSVKAAPPAGPVLNLSKGVVGDDVVTATSVFDPQYSVADPSALVRPAGDTSANPWLATIADTGTGALDNDLTGGVDAGDRVRFAIVVTNGGGSAADAFDLQVRDRLPANFDPASVANLRITRGDGSVIYDGTAGTLASITHLDGSPIATPADALAALLSDGLALVDPTASQGVLPGSLDGLGQPVAAGTNVLLITYDATLLGNAESGATQASAAELIHYADADAGANLATPDLSDSASVRPSLAQLDKAIVATDQPFTGYDAGLDRELAVIGEIIDYQVVVHIPQGTITNARFVDTMDVGLSLVGLTSAVATPGLTVSNPLGGLASATPVDWNGGSANQIIFDLGTITNHDTDNATDETITLTYRVLMGDSTSNQMGADRSNSAVLESDGGTTPLRTIPIRVAEPTIWMAIDPDRPTVYPGETVTYTLFMISQGDTPAFDVDLSDLLPPGVTYVPGSVQQTSGPAAATLVDNAGALSATWDHLDVGQSVTLTFQGTIDALVPVGQVLDHTAVVTWTSMPGTVTDRSPYVATGDTERTGAGTPDDYRATDNAPVTRLNRPPVATDDQRSTDADTPVGGQAIAPDAAQQTAGDQADTDPDLPAGDTLTVAGVQAGVASGPIAGQVGTAVAGTYGTLVLQPDGRYTWTPGPAAQALSPGDSVQDVFTYTIRDAAGATATARIRIDIAGRNDPPTAPHVAVTIDAGALEGTPASAVGSMPPPTDPDRPAQTLTVRVDAVPDPLAGRFVLPDGRTLAPGMTIEPALLQRLSFVPNAANPSPRDADGLLAAGSLLFTVDDGAGGTAAGAVDVRVRPAAVPPPVPTPFPPGPLPPTAGPPGPPLPGPGSPPPPTLPPPILDRITHWPRVDDFDPLVPWTQAPQAARDVASGAPLADAPPKPRGSRVANGVEVADDPGDCLPAPGRKPVVRPKIVAGHSELKHTLLHKSRPFSEQLGAETKRLRPPPPKVKPRVPAGRVC